MPRSAHWTDCLACVGVILLGPAGAASPAPDRGAVPADVTAWFTDEAADVVRTTLRDTVVVDPALEPRRYSTVMVGEPRALHAWSEEFRSGAALQPALDPLEEWVAPYFGDGEPGGAVVAWREEGVVTLAVLDDNARLAAALTELPPRGQVVTEPMLGAHFGLLDDTVLTLSRGRVAELPAELPLDRFQAVLVGTLDELVPAGEPEPRSRPWLPVTAALTAAAAAVAGALALRRAWRRTAPRDT